MWLAADDLGQPGDGAAAGLKQVITNLILCQNADSFRLNEGAKGQC